MQNNDDSSNVYEFVDNNASSHTYSNAAFNADIRASRFDNSYIDVPKSRAQEKKSKQDKVRIN